MDTSVVGLGIGLLGLVFCGGVVLAIAAVTVVVMATGKKSRHDDNRS